MFFSECSNLESFIVIAERTIGKSLEEQGIPVHMIRHSRQKDTGGITTRVVLCFPSDFQGAEDIITTEFRIDAGRSKTLSSMENASLYGLEYTIASPSGRGGLPEWKGFSRVKWTVIINSAFADSFISCMEALGYQPEDFLSSQKNRKIAELVSTIENSMGYNGPDRGLVPQSSYSAAPRDDREKEKINSEDIDRFFSENRDVISRWYSLADENGVELTEGETPDTASLGKVLSSLGIDDYSQLEEIVTSRLSDWEDLYMTYETARIFNYISEDSMDLRDFMEALLLALEKRDL